MGRARHKREKDPGLPRWKIGLFGLVSVVLFFGALEVVLWASGVRTLLSERDPYQGFSERVRVYELDGKRGVYRTPPRAVRHSFNYQEFSADKPANGYRIFTLGGSSAYGFPWGAGVAFTRWLGDALQAAWKDRKIEAVNAAGMSYGSHRLRILARELLEYQPDVLIVFEGHNEFVEQRFYREIAAGPDVGPLRTWLYRWRLYSGMTRLYEQARSSRVATAGGRAPVRSTGEMLGLDVVREASTRVGEADRDEVRRRFEDNVRAIVEMGRIKGVPVVLCTVPSNLSGWAPDQSWFGSEVDLDARRTVQELLAEAKVGLAGGDAAGAASRLERARALAPSYAETDFLLGKALEALGRWPEARDAYIRARDHDAMPSRALSTFNDVIRRSGSLRGAILADIERAFEEASPHGIVGSNLIEDYVHPTKEGHRRIALELWRLFMERGLLGAPREADPRVFWSVAGAAGTEDEQAEESAQAAKTPTLLFNLAVVQENKGLVDEAIKNYRACLELDPTHAIAHYNLGRLLHRQGRFEEAAAEHRRALEIDPGYVMSLVGLGEAMRALGRMEEARQAFEQATRADPASAYAWNGLGATLARTGRLPDAVAAFSRAIELDPKKTDARANMGFALLSQGKMMDAESAFRAALADQPDHVQSRDGLAAVLVERGALDEAETLFRETLTMRPDDAFARSGLAEIARRRSGRR
jgi:tetratricopeptide (TPR) repeat protein